MKYGQNNWEVLEAGRGTHHGDRKGVGQKIGGGRRKYLAIK